MSDPRPPAAGPAMTLNAWLRWDIVRRVLGGLGRARGGGAPHIRSVLEIGCGQGAVGARLASHYGDYVGYEPDGASSERARARLTRAHSAESSAAGGGRVVTTTLPDRPDRRFDLVCAFEVLEHIEDDAAALAGWAQWLSPGGTLLVSVPADPERFGAADEAVGHYRRYDPERIASLLAETGLVERELWRYGFPLGYVLEVARDQLARRGGNGPAVGSAGEASRAERTAASGRWGQPPDALGWSTRWVTLPFRLAQRPFLRSRLGTGIIAAGRRPS